MNETKAKESAYSSERTETMSPDTPAETAIATPPAATEKSQGTLERVKKAQWAYLPKMRGTEWPTSLAELREFLKRTRRRWLTAGGALVGLMATITLVERAIDWAREARERRQQQAVATVTPERLIARCGQAAEDETKEVFPIVMRTMSYQPRGRERLVLAFSRTAEEKSDWVFLSMETESGSKIYDTPEAKIAALPCLDSTK
jgi:hypothetical protein